MARLKFRVGDRVVVTWPTRGNATRQDRDLGVPWEYEGFEPQMVATITSPDHYGGDQCWQVKTDKVDKVDRLKHYGWTCREAWLTLLGGPW